MKDILPEIEFYFTQFSKLVDIAIIIYYNHHSNKFDFFVNQEGFNSSNKRAEFVSALMKDIEKEYTNPVPMKDQTVIGKHLIELINETIATYIQILINGDYISCIYYSSYNNSMDNMKEVLTKYMIQMKEIAHE